MGKDSMLKSISYNVREFLKPNIATVMKERSDRPVRRVGEFFPQGGEEEFHNLQALWELTPNNVARPIELKKNEQGVVEGYTSQWIMGPILLKKLTKKPEWLPTTRRQIIETVMTWQRAKRAHGDITTQNIIIKRDGTPVFIDPIGYPDKPATTKMLKHDIQQLNKLLKAPELIMAEQQKLKEVHRQARKKKKH